MIPRETPVDDEFNPLDFEDFPALIWRSGLDRKCSYFNRTWLAFTGRSLDQEAGDGWVEGVHPEDLEACVRTYVESFDRRESFSMEYRLRHHSGEYRWITDLGTPRHNRRGEFLGYLGSCYDVTVEREAARQLAQLNQNKSRLFSLVAHDLKGPVGAMAHLARMLADRGIAPDDIGPTADALADAGTRIQTLLEALLTWAQTQMEGFHAQLSEIDVPTALVLAAEPLRAGLAEKSQGLDIPASEAPWVRGDPELLKTVFRNLISNASKFSPPEGRIRVSWTNQPGALEVRIADEGMGIPEAVLNQLWGPGLVVSRPGTEGERGTGLGLAICREFLEAQGAGLRLESVPNRGTTAVVTLALAGPSGG
jgi:PAS domain S-box-containing protein